MLSRGDVRVCIAYSEIHDEMENSVKDETGTTGVDCTWPGISFSITKNVQTHRDNAEQCCGRLGCRPPTVSREPLQETMMISGRVLIRQAGAHDWGGRCYDE